MAEQKTVFSCGRRRAGPRRLGRGAARGRGDGGSRGRAAPLPSSAEAPAARRGPGRARLTSSILSGAGGARGARGEGRPPRGLRTARAGRPCARPQASLTETPEATGPAGAPSACFLQVWVPCPPAGQSQRQDWSVLGAAQLSLPLCSAQQRDPLVNSGLICGRQALDWAPRAHPGRDFFGKSGWFCTLAGSSRVRL